MFFFLGTTTIQRVQEARVLETGRQMLGEPLEAWLIPELNHRPRLQKPPLAYWMAAAGYKLLGVGEGSGRLLFALCGAATLVLLFSISRKLYDDTTAALTILAAAAGILFFRHMRFAETDSPAALAVTAAVWCIWRAFDAAENSPRRSAGAWWLHAAAVCTSLALLAKGAPAAYPGLFLIAMCAIERRWNMLARFFTSGAFFTLIALALPWYLIVWQHGKFEVLISELRNNAEGGNHPGWAVRYIPQLLMSTAPWSAIFVIAMAAAIVRWKTDRTLRRILIWMLAILLPLCVIGNKQRHYLLPLMPPAAILIGWCLSRAMRNSAEDSVVDATRKRRTLRAFDATIVVCGIAALGIVPAAKMVRGEIDPIDWIAAVAVAMFAVAVFTLRRPASRVFAGMFGAVLIVPMVVSAWAPSLEVTPAQRAVTEIRRQFGGGPYAFFGPTPSPLYSFYLRQELDWVETPDATAALLSRPTPPVLIGIASVKRPITEPPSGYEQVKTIRYEDDKVAVVFRASTTQRH